MNYLNKYYILMLTALVLMKSVSPLKCFMCSSDNECKNQPELIECTYDNVMKTASHFTFLPHSQTQQNTNKYSCATYEAKLVNQTSVQISGCFFNTYNPCEEVNNFPAQKWTCKYCDSRDGCNPATQINSNFIIILIFVMITVYLKLY